MKKLFVFLVLMFVNSVTFAGSTSWSNSTYSMGSYVPVKGTYAEGLMSSTGSPTGVVYISKVSFTLDSKNVSSIKDYNNKIGAGGTCKGYSSYLTLDVTSVDNGTEKLDAYYVYSNLPNPKYDLENDNLFTPYREESETVALDTVTAKDYYMTTRWADYRAGASSDSGKIQAQFGMSKKGISDYNTCVISNEVQIINSYGSSRGSY